MLSTNHTRILARTRCCLAAAALMVGVALGTPMASAEPDANGWDQEGFYKCMHEPDNRNSFGAALCCQRNGGTPTGGKDGLYGCTKSAPAPLQAPTDPAGKPPGPPPPVDAGQGPGAPVGPVPVGPGPSRG